MNRFKQYIHTHFSCANDAAGNREGRLYLEKGMNENNHDKLSKRMTEKVHHNSQDYWYLFSFSHREKPRMSQKFVEKQSLYFRT
jgi:hypothetical protein